MLAEIIYGTIDMDRHVNAARADEIKARLYESCLSEVPLLVVIIDKHGTVVWINRKVRELTGLDNFTAAGKEWADRDTVAAFAADAAQDQGTQNRTRELSLLIPSDKGSEKIIHGKLFHFGGLSGDAVNLVFIASSICEGRHDECGAFATTHDALTDLPGRTMAHDQIKQSMAKAKRTGTRAGIIFLDVDDFKTINDTLGHAAGDIVLQTVARRLQDSVRESDTVARIGGDEFIIILNEIDSEIDCETVAEKIIELFSSPINISGESIAVTTSMGISLYPGDGDTRDSLIANADAAMYYAKNSGKNKFRFFTNEINKTIQSRLGLESRLRKSIKDDKFVVVYQPVVESATGKVSGVEALVRWEDAGRLIEPMEFLSVAEDSGLILPIGETVMRTACKDAVYWAAQAGKNVSVTVNVSLRQLMSGRIPALVMDIISETGIKPCCLQIELTEKSLLYKFDYIYKQLSLLHEIGVEISLDDFGVGYCSLSCIDKAPLNTIKIDGSRVHNLVRNGGGFAFCEAVTFMSHSFSKKVIAEEVENSIQLHCLRGIGVDYVQGTYISKPLRRDTISHIFENRQPT